MRGKLQRLVFVSEVEGAENTQRRCLWSLNTILQYVYILRALRAGLHLTVPTLDSGLPPMIVSSLHVMKRRPSSPAPDRLAAEMWNTMQRCRRRFGGGASCNSIQASTTGDLNPAQALARAAKHNGT